MIWFCAVTAAVVVLIVLSPFVLAKGGQLAPSWQEHSSERLVRIKQAILKRFLADEAAYNRKEIGARTWEKRRHFLLNRYVDAAKQLDFLSHSQESTKVKE